MRIQINKIARTASANSLLNCLLTYFCPNCSSELFASWYITQNEAGDCMSEQSALHQLKRCPVCGAQLSRNRGYAMKNGSDFSPVDRLGFADDMRLPLGLESLTPRKFVTLDTNTQFKKMQAHRKQSNQQEAEHLARKLAAHCERSAESGSSDPRFCSKLPAERVAAIKTSTEQLCKYLYSIIKIETDIYSLTKQLSELYVRRAENSRLMRQAKLITAAQVKQEIISAEAQIYLYAKQLEAASRDLENIKKNDNYRPAAAASFLPLSVQLQKPTPPVLETPGLFNKRSVQERNAALMEQYNRALAEYEKSRRVQEEYQRKKNAAIKKVNDDIMTCRGRLQDARARLEQLQLTSEIRIRNGIVSTASFEAIESILNKEIDTMEGLMYQLCASRKWLYGQDIIYAKYRNIETISHFYEYLSSGRCSVLEGPHGAINLYETERRSDMVMSKLSHIADSLDQIAGSLDEMKDTQHALYTELRRTNFSLDKLNRGMDDAIQSIHGLEANAMEANEYLDFIARSSHCAAFYSQVNSYYAMLNTDLRRVFHLM